MSVFREEITAYFSQIKGKHGEYITRQEAVGDPRRTVEALEGVLGQW